MKNGIALLCLSAALVGCSSQSMNSQSTSSASVNTVSPAVPKPRTNDPKVLWKHRQNTLAQMQRWRLNGRVGLQLNSRSWAFGLQWAQNGANRYSMNFLNPLTGGVLAALNNTGSQVSLASADGKRFTDTSAERLLEKQLGVRLPLEGMRYWARGTVDPRSVVEGVKLDARGRPTLLKQQGWTITYPAYLGNGNTAMPRRVQLSRTVDRMKVKLVVKNWKVN